MVRRFVKSPTRVILIVSACVNLITGQANRRMVMECYWVLGQRIDFLANAETTGGNYSLFLSLYYLLKPRPLAV